MNKKELDLLLEKYYQGETSLAENEQLRAALNDESVDAFLIDGLAGIANEEIEIPADLERSISDKIDEWEAAEHRVDRVALLWWHRRAWWAVAASIVAVAAIGWWLMSDKLQTSVERTTPIIAEAPVPAVPVSEPQKIEDVAEHNESQQLKPKIRPAMRRVEKRQLAQARSLETDDLELTVAEQEKALAALEKFSTVLDKGVHRLTEVGEKMEEINNTIQQHLYID